MHSNHYLEYFDKCFLTTLLSYDSSHTYHEHLFLQISYELLTHFLHCLRIFYVLLISYILLMNFPWTSYELCKRLINFKLFLKYSLGTWELLRNIWQTSYKYLANYKLLKYFLCTFCELLAYFLRFIIRMGLHIV